MLKLKIIYDKGALNDISVRVRPISFSVPDCGVAVGSCVVGDWVLVKVKHRDFRLGNIGALMESNPGVIAETIWVTEPFEGIYSLMCEASSYGHLDKVPYKLLLSSDNFQYAMQMIYITANWPFESVRWLTD